MNKLPNSLTLKSMGIDPIPSGTAERSLRGLVSTGDRVPRLNNPADLEFITSLEEEIADLEDDLEEIHPVSQRYLQSLQEMLDWEEQNSF